MSDLRFKQFNNTGEDVVVFQCPGCDIWHSFRIRATGDKPVWDWNGDLDIATFEPSLMVNTIWGPNREKRVCHSFVREGRIQFLSDCTHDLVGQTVEVPGLNTYGRT